MKDQAESLRKLVSEQAGTVTIAVAAAKLGGGATSIAVNLAVSLMLHEKRVILLDIGNSTIELLGGKIQDKEEALREFFKGNLQLQDILIQTPVGLKVLMQAAIMVKTGELERRAIEQVKQELGKLGEADYVIVHLPVGVTKESIPFIIGSDTLLLVSEPDIEAVRETYGMIKSINQRVRKDKMPGIHLIINKSLSKELSETLAERLGNGVHKFLDKHIIYNGAIPLDKAVAASREFRKPYVIHAPDSPASRNVEKITAQILNNAAYKSENHTIDSGIQKLIDQVL